VFTSTSGHRPRHKSYDKPEDLLRDADTAMYRAKVLAARYEVFDTAMHDHVVTLLQLETSPWWAVERQESDSPTHCVAGNQQDRWF